MVLKIKYLLFKRFVLVWQPALEQEYHRNCDCNCIRGPGAVFWMWIISIISSASSFVESTLAQIYKVKDKTGFRGGPSYYMEKGLNKRWMGVLFSILITITFGLVFNSVQSNTVTIAFQNSFGTDRLTVGIIMAIAFAAIIFGGVQRIAKWLNTRWYF